MELAGFSVDKAGIEEYGKALSVRIEELEKAVWQEVGYEFNLNSPKQLGVALFESLGPPCRKKPKADIPPVPKYWRIFAAYTLRSIICCSTAPLQN